ncbi:hypothetical protein [Bacillus sp. X1(2014)]|uniref:hypothetical protein n=1 Tax=Bacillus sp. X1(2014) TaxID=1565991 RepID=UPI0011A20B46|nr:hypothetical protein [Bacillus sp. X1(2014)]
MLTTAQQKVKQELEELQLKAFIHPNDKTVSPSKRHSSKKRIILITGFILLMVTCSLFLKNFWTQKELGITSYLTKVYDYNHQSETILNNFLNGTLGNLAQSLAEQENLLVKVKNLKTPSNFQEHQQDLIAVIQHRLDMMKYLKGPIHSDQIQLSQSLIELRVKQELAADSLIKGFKQGKIKYKQKENGTVQYWINSKSYSLKN